MSSSLPDMSGYREDTVVDMWPQVLHRVHVLIGAFIVGSGQRGQIRSNQCRLSYHQIKHRHTLNFILVYLLYSGISGTVSNMSLLTIHYKLREKLLDPTGVLLCNFLMANLCMSLLQFPFSSSSSFAGRYALQLSNVFI